MGNEGYAEGYWRRRFDEEDRRERQTEIEQARLAKWCVMCGAAPGEPCTYISGDLAFDEIAGQPRPHPHFYRNSDERPAVAVKDEPGWQT